MKRDYVCDSWIWSAVSAAEDRKRDGAVPAETLSAWNKRTDIGEKEN